MELDQALQKGIEAHKAGKVQEADRYYTAILKADPKHPDANHNMGILAVGVGKVKEALPFLKTALDTNANIDQFWLSYIDALIKLDQLDEAKEVFETAKTQVAKGDGFDQLQKRLGLSNKECPSYDTLTETLETNQSSTLDIAIKLRESGEFNQAIDLLKDELNRFDEDSDMLAVLSHCYLLADELELAKLYLDKAKKIASENASVGWNTARLMLKEKNPLGALNVARDTSQKFPDDVEGMGVLGACLRVNDKIVESLDVLNRAIRLNPNHTEALINRGLIKLNQKNKTEALADLQQAHRLKPHIRQIWDLVVGLKVEAQEYSDAILLLSNMIEIDNENEKRLSTLALCYQHLKDFDSAIKAYKKVLFIQPDYAEVHTNIGSAFKEQGKLDEAIDAYKKALAIKPDYAAAYNNMGVALEEQGKLQEAIEAYNNALVIKPDYDEPWNNILFPLQSIKLKVSSQEELVSYYPKDTGSNYHQIAVANLNYILNLGGVGAESSLDKALVMLSKADGIVIKNPASNNGATGSEVQLTDKVVALVHWGRSGTGLLHSLIDDHPEVSTLPSIYLSEYFDHATWGKIICGGWSHMVDSFMAIYDVLFDAKSKVPVHSRSLKLHYNIGLMEGMGNVGDQRNEVLRVDKEIFRVELQRLMSFYGQLDALLFFKLVHKAYDKAISDVHQKSLIFYHIHNPGPYAQLNFVRSSPNANWVMMVREPVQSCESLLKTAFQKNEYFDLTVIISSMLFEIDNIIYHKQNSVGVRLEDLKERPQQTIPAICNWIGIEETDSLYKMTAQGKKWWGDPSSPDFAQDGMNPFGKTSINRKIGSVFSESDQYILHTLFYPFSVRFGYVEANAEQFKIDLQMIKPMLDNMFDFEKAIAKRTHVDQEQFMKSGSYLYLRSVLIERWDILKEFGTYPNMIKPLNI